MSSAITKGNFNPYRHGVLMGNFVEDIFGEDLAKKYRCKSHQEHTRQNKITEHMDKYRWPKITEKKIITSGNALSNKNSNAFDFNIDFSKKKLKLKTEIEDPKLGDSKSVNYIKTLNNINTDSNMRNTFYINKNIIYPEELYSINQKEKLGQKTMTRFNTIHNEIKNRLGQLYLNDVKEVLNTRSTGQNARMFFGHGLDFRKFNKNEFASTYHLTMNEKIRTETFYNPRYVVTKPFKKQPNIFYDNKDMGYRRFKKYDIFTKAIDKATILQK